MVQTDELDLRCAYHPDVSTRLRCSRCEKPICPRCMVATPIGYRCPDCARGPKPLIYQVSAASIAMAGLGGAAVALAVGVVWGLYPQWVFLCCLALGFGVSETVAYLARLRRGTELLAVSIGCVLLGIVTSRLVMAWDSPILTVDMLLNHLSDPGVAAAFQLQAVPYLLYMAIPFVIVWIRFR